MAPDKRKSVSLCVVESLISCLKVLRVLASCVKSLSILARVEEEKIQIPHTTTQTSLNGHDTHPLITIDCSTSAEIHHPTFTIRYVRVTKAQSSTGYINYFYNTNAQITKRSRLGGRNRSTFAKKKRENFQASLEIDSIKTPFRKKDKLIHYMINVVLIAR